MKRISMLIFVVIFSIYPLSTGITGEGFIIDGNEWETMSEGLKISFVSGWIKCGKAASDNLFFYVNNWDESMKYLNLQNRVFKEQGISLAGVTVGQVLSTVNIMYSDPRLKIIDIQEIMPLVSGRLIQGWTERELDEVVSIKVKLWRCEKEKGMTAEECISSRKARNAYMEKLRNK